FGLVPGLAETKGKPIFVEVNEQAPAETQYVQTDDAVNTTGEFGGFTERGYHHAQIASAQGSNLQFGNVAPADFELPVKVENSGVLAGQRQFVSDFRVQNAVRCSRVQNEFQTGQRSDLAVNNDQETAAQLKDDWIIARFCSEFVVLARIASCCNTC